MFKSLKSKLVSVKRDVTTSIKTMGNEIGTKITYVGENPKGREDVTSPILNSAPLQDTQSTESREPNDAAQDLLKNYEIVWEELYRDSQNNLVKSQCVVEDLHQVQHTVCTCEKKIGELETEFKELPSLLASVQQITNQIGDLHSQCSLIEDSLALLEDLCERTDLQKAKLEEQCKLVAYEKGKEKLVAEYTEKLAKDHNTKIIALEMREAEVRREKELFYQKAFEEDIRRFKTEQTLVTSQRSLEDMTIEPNTDEAQKLEDFLNDSLEDNRTNSLGGFATDGHSPRNETNTADTHETNVSPRNRTDSEQSNRQHTDSNDSLEWDDFRQEDLDDVGATKQLECSLELEINGIIAESQTLSDVLTSSTTESSSSNVEE